MISYLKGKVILSSGSSLILETGGVGYKMFCSKNYSGEKEFYIHEVIREDCHDLYGFEKYDDLILFEKLVSVNGIGPKAGLNIMSSASSEEIQNAIVGGNVDFFLSISGIGKKAAAKIILELKSKLSSLDDLNILEKMDQSDGIMDALISLGYKKVEIAHILHRIPKEIIKSEERIRWCLKNIK
jgi:Holliday junction DNA helicase RuvA